MAAWVTCSSAAASVKLQMARGRFEGAQGVQRGSRGVMAITHIRIAYAIRENCSFAPDAENGDIQETVRCSNQIFPHYPTSC